MERSRASLSQSHPSSLNLRRNENPWISIAALPAPYLGVVAVIEAAEGLGSGLARVLALPLIGALQNHLQILLHEGAHFQIHRKKRWNDLLTNVFCGIPFLGLVRHYRHFHFAHHRHLLDPEKDPEVGFYAEQGYFYEKQGALSLAKMLFLDLSGYHYFQFFFSYHSYLWREIRGGRMPGLGRWDALAAALALGGALALGMGSGGVMKLLFYWFAPQPTFLFLFLKLQGYGEHSKRNHSVEGCTFSHELGWVARFFVYPLNSNLHLEHHLFPAVPWYRLRSVRAKGSRGYFFGPSSILRRELLGTRVGPGARQKKRRPLKQRSSGD